MVTWSGWKPSTNFLQTTTRVNDNISLTAPAQLKRLKSQLRQQTWGALTIPHFSVKETGNYTMNSSEASPLKKNACYWITQISAVARNRISSLQLFVTPWTVAHQAPPSMGFSRQEHWSGLTFSFPGDLPHPGIEPRFPTLQADALTSEPPGKPNRIS